MSKEDEVIKLLKNHEVMVDNFNYAVFSPYKSLASEIVKLFEVEGKTGYIIQRLRSGLWIKRAYVWPTKETAKERARELSEDYPNNKYRVLKHTIINEMIED